MDEDRYEPKPVGPLGAAFADLVQDPPPTSLSPLGVIAEARRGSRLPRPMLRSTVLAGVAAAAVGLIVVGIAVFGDRGGPGDTAAGAAESSPAADGAASTAAAEEYGADQSVAMEASGDAQGDAPAESAAEEQITGGGVDDARTGEAAVPSLDAVPCAELPLSDEQTALVLSSFPQMTPTELPEEFCGRLGSPVGYGEFTTEDGRRIIVRLAIGAEVPDNCEPVEGPTAALRCVDGGIEGDWVSFVAIVGDRIAAVDADPGALGTLPNGDFAALADALLAGG